MISTNEYDFISQASQVLDFDCGHKLLSESGRRSCKNNISIKEIRLLLLRCYFIFPSIIDGLLDGRDEDEGRRKKERLKQMESVEVTRS